MSPFEIYFLTGTILGVSILKTYIYVCCRPDTITNEEPSEFRIPPKYEEINDENDDVYNNSNSNLIMPPTYSASN